MRLLKKIQFRKTMDLFCTKGIFDPIKIKDQTKKDDLKNLIENLVRTRQPIVLDFVNQFNDDKDFMSWLYSCGYSYYKQGKKFTFLCTCENQFDIRG